MNEKFFDLKKEKQDRMINAALKIFGLNGYEHASTDEIVREAGISKGLLFHYFISKLGLYTFVYDYSVRYMLLELGTGVAAEETDLFSLLGQVLQSQVQVMKTYPYMQLFLQRSRSEDVGEALLATEEKRMILPEKYGEIMEKADQSSLKAGVDKDKLLQMFEYTANGLMQERFCDGSFQPELYHAELKEYLKLLKGISSRE